MTSSGRIGDRLVAQTPKVHILSVLCAGASYGLVTPLVKQAVRSGVATSSLSMLQYPAALLFLVVARYLMKSPPMRLRAHLVWPLLAVGVSSAATTICYYQSLKHLPPAMAVLLLFQFSWMLPVMGWLASRRRPSLIEVAAIALIVIGTILALSEQFHGPLTTLGMIEGLGAGVSYAFTLFWQARIASDTPVLNSAFLTIVIAALTVFLFYHNPSHLFTQNWSQTVGYGSVAGIFSLVLPLGLLYLSAPKLGDTLTAILASVELPTALVISLIWLKSSITLFEWLGCMLILGGITLASVWDRAVPRG